MHCSAPCVASPPGLVLPCGGAARGCCAHPVLPPNARNRRVRPPDMGTPLLLPRSQHSALPAPHLQSHCPRSAAQASAPRPGTQPWLARSPRTSAGGRARGAPPVCYGWCCWGGMRPSQGWQAVAERAGLAVRRGDALSGAPLPPQAHSHSSPTHPVDCLPPGPGPGCSSAAGPGSSSRRSGGLLSRPAAIWPRCSRACRRCCGACPS